MLVLPGIYFCNQSGTSLNDDFLMFYKQSHLPDRITNIWTVRVARSTHLKKLNAIFQLQWRTPTTAHALVRPMVVATTAAAGLAIILVATAAACFRSDRLGRTVAVVRSDVEEWRE